MSDSTTFPEALRTSAVPRWSHRDPVEGGNPFSLDDSRHETWQTATCHARDALVRNDQELEAREKDGAHPDPYPIRLVSLAVARFDVWARRGLSIVRGDAALRDYEQWLATYRENWLAYVQDTCPRVEVGDNLRFRLAAQEKQWLGEARRAVSLET